jgi:hypothetical protein
MSANSPQGGACTLHCGRQGWGGRPVRQEQAQGILIAGLGMLAMHSGYSKAKRAS